MRILVLTPDLSQGGGVTNYYNSLRLEEIGVAKYFSVNRPNTAFLLSKIFYAFFIYLRFIRVSRGFNLIHINPSLNPKSFYRDMIFISLARLMRKNTLVFFRGWEDSFQHAIEQSKFKSFLFRHSYAKADRYIVLGRLFQDKLHQLGVDPSKPFHIETTVADSSGMQEFNLEKKLETAKKEITCLFISRILKEKGIYIAIDAFNRCRTQIKNKNMTFIIAGDGEELPAAQEYVRTNNIEFINFVGNVTGADKISLLANCHIMLFPTLYGEGLPNCILEGMLYGMPIISRHNAGIPDIVKDKVNGYLSDSVVAEPYTDFLCNLVNDEYLYTRIAKTNHEKALSAFTTEMVRERLINIYKLASQKT